MFDDAIEDVSDALAETNAALSFAEAKAAAGGDEFAEQAVLKEADIEEEDGQRWVISTSVDDRTYDIPEPEGSDDAQDASDDAQADAEQDDGATVADGGAAAQEPMNGADSISLEADAEKDYYRVNGLRIDANPERLLVGQPTGREHMGCQVLTNDHPAVPETDIPYLPVDLGERDTEEMFMRAMSLRLPMILEGEQGTGKNQLIDAKAAKLNLPTYRMEFGADSSVYDLVGERDIVGDETYYVLGKAAKAAMFGGILVADEINMASGSVTSYLHPLFEDVGSRELELRGTGRTLRDLPEDEEWDPEKHLGRYIHPEFRAVGTCNPLSYADTKSMNSALRGRCVVMEHPYVAESETDSRGVEREAELVASEIESDSDIDAADVDASALEPVVRLAALLRECRREGNQIQTPIGHREIRDTVKLAGPEEEFMSYESAAKVKMAGQAELPDDRQFIEDTIEEEL